MALPSNSARPWPTRPSRALTGRPMPISCATVKSWFLIGGAQIAMCELAQIDQILLP